MHSTAITDSALREHRKPHTGTVVLHCSDIHVGRGFLPECAAGLVRVVGALQPDAVVVSGDLTVRARRWQFAEAVDWLQKLSRPLLVVPGNHDVPLYHLLLRFTAPFRNYEEAVKRLDPVAGLSLPHVTVMGINSINPSRHQQGMIRMEDRQAVRMWARQTDPAQWRVVVVHQQFMDFPGHHRPGRIPNAEEIIAEWHELGIDCVLHGHTHFAHVTLAGDFFPGMGQVPVIIGAGTASNRRVRGPEPRANSFQVLEFNSSDLAVHTFSWDSEKSEFLPSRQVSLKRQGR